MMCLVILALIWALSSYLYSLIATNPWLWFLWVVLGLLTTVILFVGWLYLIVLPTIKRMNPNNKLKIFYTIHILKMVNFLSGAKVKVEGRENLTKETKVLYVANHKSMVDPCLIYQALKSKGPTAASKSELWNIKLLVPFLESFRVIKINRGSDREAAKSIVEGIKYIKDGNGVIIFPEGGIKTREVEQMVSIKPGAYKLAVKSEAVIQPMVIIGSSKISQRKFFSPFVNVTIRILPPLTYDDYKDLNTHEIAYKVLNMVNENFPDEEKYSVEEEN
jgi:1-acyl-sn-glycerol-3-phosphate acyltransferase